MLTSDELAAIPIFSTLSPVALADVARAAADIYLSAGEYAVYEGEPAALFVVLEGAIEVIKLVDGVERKLGMRLRHNLFGEIPLVYGAQFQAGFRAGEPSRVVKVDARIYYDIAATSPELVKRMDELARERIGGLQKLAAEPHTAHVALLGTRWGAACLDLRRFLERNQISFSWLTIDDPNLADHWPGPPPDVNDCPTLRFADGTKLVRPQPREFAARLGLQTAPRFQDYDTVIIGGGPAGLAAAVYGASEGLRTIVVEQEAPGGQAETSSRIENYLGFPSGISGSELASRALRQAKRLGAEILVARKIVRLDAHARRIMLDNEEVLNARTVIVASGVSWRRLNADGFDRLLGKGIFYGAARSEASIAQGLDVHLIGAGNSAGQAAMFFANHARTVTLIVRADSLEKSMSHYLIDQIRTKSNIRTALQSEVTAVYGETHMTALDILDRGANEVRREDSGGLFVFIGADAETSWLPPEIARDPRGYILTGGDVVKAGQWNESRDPYLVETSVPGVFACGDVRFSPVKRVASAVGEGSIAIAFVHQYLASVASP
jgi:thioredoxin reductase (NADPH)